MTRPRPVVRFPLHLERQYARRLLRRLAVLRRFAEAALARRADNEADAMRARMALEAARRAAGAVLPTDFGESLVPTARAVDAFATRQTTRALGVLGVDVEADRRIGDRSQREMHRLHVGWARENVALTQDLDRRTWTDLAEHVAEAVRDGRTDLAGVLEDRFGVAGSRARLIARDQIGSLNARITEARQRQIGIQAYEWSSSGDGRVRPLHRKLDGTIRRWDEPHPTEGHPGEAIACRCVAIPVVDDVPAPTPVLPRPPALPPAELRPPVGVPRAGGS